MTPEAAIIEALFRIPNKEGVDVDFHLNTAQRMLDDGLTGRDLVPKARQEGVSSYCLARFLAACLMHRNVRAVVISHDMESTQRLLARVRYFLDNIKGPKALVANMSKNEITFPKTNSMFYIGTAGSRKFGRGDTITHLHCSEYAYWPGATELMAGLLQAVPMSGEVIIESTGNGYNDYYTRCIRAYEGKSIWSVHFLPWHTFHEYTLPLTEHEKMIVQRTAREEWGEPELLSAGLDPSRLAWRRMKLDELNYDITSFRQEYPMTLDECFQMSSESIFSSVLYEPTDRWERVELGYWILKDHPDDRAHYVLGADVGAGVGRDGSVVEVWCLETGEQVAEYTTDRLDPEAFAARVAQIGSRFGTAYAVVEANNHGILTLARLKEVYPRDRIHTSGTTFSSVEEKRLHVLGYRTTARTKPLMIGQLRTLLAHEWTVHSPLLRAQLSTFIEHDNGKLEAQDGCQDDAVMAAACAAVGRVRASLVFRPPVVRLATVRDPFTLDSIIEERHGGALGFPVRPQSSWN